MTTVADILNRKGPKVYSVSPEATVFDAVAGMVEHNVGSLIVTEGETIHGIITERDYLRKIILKGRSSRETPVREIMSTRIAYASPEQSVEEAMAVMSELRIRHLPVMAEGRLAGLVSIGDCVQQISSDRKARIAYLTDYIADRYPR